MAQGLGGGAGGFTLLLASMGLTVQAQTLTEVVNQALQTYPSVLSAAAKASASRSDIARARSAHYPQLGMTATVDAYLNLILEQSA